MLFAYNHPVLGATSGANGWIAIWVAPMWGPQAEKAQGIMALTDVAIKNAKAREKPYKLGDAGGLFLLVQPSGGKLWRMKYRVDGREKKLGIGVYPDVSLADARKRRDDARELIAAGKDPSREKQRSKIRARTQAENTFTAIAAEYCNKRKRDGDKAWAAATATRSEYLLSLLDRSIGKMAINEIEPPDVLAAIRKIEGTADPTDGDLKSNTALLDGVRQFAMDVRELDIDLIDSINPWQAAYAVLAKSMSESTLKQVQAANGTNSLAVDECYSLVEAERYEEAVMPCRQAAEQGDAGAQVNLGWLYDNGLGVPEDHAMAVNWFGRAADQGDSTGQNNLGLMYDSGRGVPEDDAEAMKWYRLAAEQGNADAKARLEELQPSEDLEALAASLSSDAEASLTGDDFLEAKRIARAGYANAKVSHLVGPDIPRGVLYSGFIIGLDPSSADALVVKGEFSAAASLYFESYRTNGDPDAAHNLGLMYSRGLGVQKDRSKALDFLMFSQSNRRWDADSWEIDKLSR